MLVPGDLANCWELWIPEFLLPLSFDFLHFFRKEGLVDVKPVFHFVPTSFVTINPINFEVLAIILGRAFFFGEKLHEIQICPLEDLFAQGRRVLHENSCDEMVVIWVEIELEASRVAIGDFPQMRHQTRLSILLHEHLWECFSSYCNKSLESEGKRIFSWL